MKEVAVVGAGYVGQPFAGVLSSSYDVTAIDVNRRVVDSLNSGVPTIHEPGLKELFSKNRERLRATADYAALEDADYVVLCVGTPEEQPWNTVWLEDAARSVGEHMRSGTTVVVRSTVPVGTTRKLGEIINESGYTAGADYGLAHAPERMREGRAVQDMYDNVHVIGGIDTKSGADAARLFEGAELKTRLASSPEETEYFKLAVNAQLARQVAEQNQLARECDAFGLDIDAVKALLLEDPRMAHLGRFVPGYLGGYCLPKDQQITAHSLRSRGVSSPLLDAAQAVHAEHVQYTAKRIATETGGPTTLFGVAFKGDTGDMRHTQVKPLHDELKKRGRILKLHDPLAESDEVARIFGAPLVTLDEAVECETAVITTDHTHYKSDDFVRRLEGKIVFDARNVLPPDGPYARYIGVGRRR